jgi:hypothetical protein
MRGSDDDSSSASDIGSDMESPMTSPPKATSGGPPARSVAFKVPSLTFGRPDLNKDAHNSNLSAETSLSRRYESGAVSNDAGSGVNYTVELLSPAFVHEAGALDPTYLRRECASKLGVREDRLQLYALVPVDVNDSNALGSLRIGVEVQNSGELLSLTNAQLSFWVRYIKFPIENLYLPQIFLCEPSKRCWLKIIDWLRTPLLKKTRSFRYKKKLRGFDTT